MKKSILALLAIVALQWGVQAYADDDFLMDSSDSTPSATSDESSEPYIPPTAEAPSTGEDEVFIPSSDDESEF